MNKHNILHIIMNALVVLFLQGCGKKELTENSNGEPSGNKLTSLNRDGTVGLASPPHPAISERDRDIEIGPKQIRKRHADLFLQELPDYVEDLRGTANKLRTNQKPVDESGVYAHWGFVVPPERIEEFEGYLLNVGVPSEHISNPTDIMRSAKREKGWKIPDPPKKSLEFLRTITPDPGEKGSSYGLEFKSDEFMIYVLDNPNKWNSYIMLRFSPVSGNVFITEKCIDWGG